MQYNSQRDAYGPAHSNNGNTNYNGNNAGNHYGYNQYNQTRHGTLDNAPVAAAAATSSQRRYYNGFIDDPPAAVMTEKPSHVTPVKAQKERSKCLPCFPCIRTTWGRCTLCFCIILLLIIIVLVILIFAVFKMPTVDYLGMDGDPTFTFNQGNTTLGINLVTNIQVKNPNPIGFSFEYIDVTAYYPGYAPSIGGGNVTNVDFPSKSTEIIHFPVNATYDRHQDPGFTVIQNILTRCGLLGATDGQITINYDIKVKTRIIGIPFTPTLKNQTTSFACPVDIGQIAYGIPAGIISGISGLISRR
ncbi:hypothetical protein BGZ98_009674 [Dissophora globulifera]|nr:hypothetical protein BGZ98_009674 [Dissophora globulifera]